METKKNLRDLCTEAKNRMGYTMQDIADATGISESTVKNIFSATSKEPSVEKMGAICSFLGIDMNRYFKINVVLSPEEQMLQMQHDHQSELEIAHLKGGMEQMAKTIDYQRKKSRDTKFAIYGLTFLCAIFMAVIVGYIFFDYRIPHQGLIQGGEASIFAWIVFLLLAVGIGFFAAILMMHFRYAKKYTLSPDKGGDEE